MNNKINYYLNIGAVLISSLETDAPTDSTTYDCQSKWPSSTGFGETTYEYMQSPYKSWIPLSSNE